MGRKCTNRQAAAKLITTAIRVIHATLTHAFRVLGVIHMSFRAEQFVIVQKLGVVYKK